jgi:hypothetical protein
MRTPWKIAAAAVLATSAALAAQTAGAAPLSAAMALKTADMSQIETVQFRHRGGGHWIGPAAGFAAGVAIGSLIVPRSSYYDYGYAPVETYDPGYTYVPVDPYYSEGYRPWAGSGRRGCTQDNKDEIPTCQ